MALRWIRMNEDLNKLSIYADKHCVHCGRKYPETLLNIEGFIHHGVPYECLDKKACNKIIKKKRK